MLFEKRSFAKSTPNEDLILPDDLNIKYLVIRPIKSGDELFVDYGDNLAKALSGNSSVK